MIWSGVNLKGDEFKMIDFKKELENFKPCLNVEQTEEAIYSNDLKDFTDIVKETVEQITKNQTER